MNYELHPFLDKSLKFKWSKLTPEQAKIDIPLAIQNCQQQIDELTNLLNLSDEQITYNSTFKVFDNIFDEFSQAWSLFTHLNSVKDSPDQRSAFKELNPKYIDFSTSIYHNPQLWQLFKRSYSKIQSQMNDPQKKISDIELRYVEKVIHEFQRSGADLDDEGKKEMSRINQELADVTDAYKKNLLDSRVEFEFFVKKGDEHMLEGLPETAIALLSSKKKKKSKKKEKNETKLNESKNINNETKTKSESTINETNKASTEPSSSNNNSYNNESKNSNNESNINDNDSSNNESNKTSFESNINNNDSSNKESKNSNRAFDGSAVSDSSQCASNNNVESSIDDDDNDHFYRFSLDAPLVSLVMKYAKNESIRKRMWEGLCSIGCSPKYNNAEHVYKILELRDRKAKLLGYSSFADFMTENRMIKSGDNALKFVDDLRDRCYAKYLEENEELWAFKSRLTDDDSSEILPWERAYYSELLRQEKYDFNDELLRPYFAVSNVMEGVFSVTSTLYGIDVKERQTFYYTSLSTDPVFNNSDQEHITSQSVEESVEVWSEDVKYYEVYDSRTKELLGAFYADWLPRDDKRSGAWEKQLVSMSINSPKNVATINGSLAKAVGGKPALLTRRSAQTIFHEFGHLCHFLLSTSPIKSLSGTHVMRDFVEFPSRFLENWTWDKQSLDLFARHCETGELIPDDLFDKMIRARNFHSATHLIEQLRICKVDIELHHHLGRYVDYERDCAKRMSIDEIDEEILCQFRDPKMCQIRPPSLIYNSKHLFASSVGYAANYYSYKWAEVLEADAFTMFKNGQIMNKELGHRIRDTIICMGNLKPPDQLFRDFMGRDPDSTAFFERYGIQ